MSDDRPTFDDDPDYSKLESLLYRGFLTLRGSVGSVPIVLKTLNERERDIISYRSDDSFESMSAHQIAYSLLFFNGVNILRDRPSYLHYLLQWINSIPFDTRFSLLVSIKHLNRKAQQELQHVTPYCYGDKSRQKWKSMRSMMPNDPSMTGIEGTGRLGLNQHQEMWITMNRQEDRLGDHERQWELHAFQASAWNSEGITKVRRKKNKRKRKREEKREALYKSKGRADVSEKKGEIHIHQDSAEDLLDQMERANEGVQDLHDKVVAKHERNIKETVEQEQREWDHKKERARRKRQQQMDHVSDDEQIVVMDQDDVEAVEERQEEERRRHRREGNYTNRRDFNQRVGRLQRWGIVEGDDKIQHVAQEDRPNRPIDESDRSDDHDRRREESSGPDSMRGTVLEDHYEEVEDHMSNKPYPDRDIPHED